MLRDRADGSEDGLADLYLEGTDQHRGWFHSSHVAGLRHAGPRTLSRGADPRVYAGRKGHEDVQIAGQYDRAGDVVKQYGADILRLWVAQIRLHTDQRIGPEILKGVADSYRRLRNTMRFMLGPSRTLLGSGSRRRQRTCQSWNAGCCIACAELDETVRKGYDAYDFQGCVPGASFCDG